MADIQPFLMDYRVRVVVFSVTRYCDLSPGFEFRFKGFYQVEISISRIAVDKRIGRYCGNAIGFTVSGYLVQESATFPVHTIK